MSAKYDAASIEILSGLEPVRKNPGMFTDTTNPNHLVQEVIDNSVAEALAGYAREITLQLNQDGSIKINDDGRGMPVDLHPKQKKPGAEVILTTLHAGGKFSHKHYRHSGGLHGVGVSVVNALSSQLEVHIRRDGKEYAMAFKRGVAVGKMKVVGKVGKKNTGTTIQFSPDKAFFCDLNFNRVHLKRSLQAKAILCPNLKVCYYDEVNKEKLQWEYSNSLDEYFTEMLAGKQPFILNEHFSGKRQAKSNEFEWCVNWLVDSEHALFTASYANLVPTPQGGTHDSGFRAGLTAAIREFIQFHKLAPKNVRITTEDITANLCYLLSVKIDQPEFSGQTKERLNSPAITGVVQNIVYDTFSLWLNQHQKQSQVLAELVLANAQKRQRKTKNVARKSSFSSLNLPAKLSDCTL